MVLCGEAKLLAFGYPVTNQQIERSRTAVQRYKINVILVLLLVVMK